jgi:PTH1 family peptidyl-tRNA hydrolase
MSTLIIGLGNPGKIYEKTRHNAGFLAVDFVSQLLDADAWKESKKLHAFVAEASPSPFEGEGEGEVYNQNNKPLSNPARLRLDEVMAGGSPLRKGRGPIIFAKPTTFMNESGLAVASLAKYYKIKPQNIIIIYDELDLPFGSLRVRDSGSSAGHNGIKSIIQHLSTDEFFRIRIGTQNEFASKIPAEKFVLNNFSTAELKELKEKILPEVLEKIKEIIK